MKQSVLSDEVWQTAKATVEQAIRILNDCIEEGETVVKPIAPPRKKKANRTSCIDITLNADDISSESAFNFDQSIIQSTKYVELAAVEFIFERKSDYAIPIVIVLKSTVATIFCAKPSEQLSIVTTISKPKDAHCSLSFSVIWLERSAEMIKESTKVNNEVVERMFILRQFEKIQYFETKMTDLTLKKPAIEYECEKSCIAILNLCNRRVSADASMFTFYQKQSSNDTTACTTAIKSNEHVLRNYQQNESSIWRHFDLIECQFHASNINADVASASTICSLPFCHNLTAECRLESICISCDLQPIRHDGECSLLYTLPHFEYRHSLLDINIDEKNEKCKLYVSNNTITKFINLEQSQSDEIIEIFIHDIVIVTIFAFVTSANVQSAIEPNESRYQSEVRNSGVFLMRRSQSIGANYTIPDEEMPYESSKRTLDINAISPLIRVQSEKYDGFEALQRFGKIGANISIAAGSVHGIAYASLKETLWCEANFTQRDRKLEKSPSFDVSVEARSEHETVDAHIEIADCRKTVVQRSFITVSDTRQSTTTTDDCRSMEASSLSIASTDRSFITSMGDFIGIDIPNYAIKQYSTATISCELCSDLECANIIWYKGKDPLQMVHGKIRRSSRQNVETLTIVNVQPKDSDLYSIYSDSLLFPVAFLIVEETDRPQVRLINYSETTFVMEGQAIAVLCIMNPEEGQVTWFKENDKLVEDNRIKIFNDGIYHRLTIDNVTMQDQAKYTSKAGDATFTTMLIVEGKSKDDNIDQSNDFIVYRKKGT